MRTLIPITCALCVASSSRADTPPAEAPPEPAPAQAPEQTPEQPAAASPAPAPAVAPAKPPAAPVTDDFAAPPPPRPKHSRIPEIAATIVTAGVVGATAASYWKWNEAHDRRRAAQWDPTVTVDEHNRNIEDTERWKKRTWILIGASFASTAITAFTWMRNQDPSSFSVQPTGDGAGAGATVSYGGRF